MRRLDFVRTVAALVAVGVLLLHGGAIAQSARPTLVMISIDGLRPDYVTAADAHALKIPNLTCAASSRTARSRTVSPASSRP